MAHPILAQIDDLDSAIGNSADVTPTMAKKARDLIGGLRKFMDRDLGEPAPVSTKQVSGATITERPDLAYNARVNNADPDAERERQAAMQGDGGYPPLRKGPLPEMSLAGGGGTIQEPAKPHPAEPAKIGGERR